MSRSVKKGLLQVEGLDLKANQLATGPPINGCHAFNRGLKLVACFGYKEPEAGAVRITKRSRKIPTLLIFRPRPPPTRHSLQRESNEVWVC